jgi:hypothetical protein
LLDYVIAGASGLLGAGVATCLLVSRAGTETAGVHRRPRGCPPDPVLRLAIETAGTHGLGLGARPNPNVRYDQNVRIQSLRPHLAELPA